ncbi:MAG: VWA domain-containing protein [Treponema sp.]|nr:VWA domain-containing protein [Treponema sp.]
MTDFSSFSIAKPHILILITAVLPAVLFVLLRLKKLLSHTSCSGSDLRALRASFFLRTILRAFAWIFMILALSDISFGSEKVPVTKSTSNVSLVFDISYSMLAKDAGKNITRLDAVKIYASSLVENLPSSSFSVILAKGSGFTAVPDTEDRSVVLNLIENLSPHLMTKAGSSLAKGIEAALEGIPHNSPKSQHIVLFTDGDETDNQLEKSLENAVKSGVPVTILGFGDEKETEITAGDGKTKVKTALRAQKLREICENVNKSAFFSNISVSYSDAKTPSSARKIIRSVEKSAGKENTVSYENRNVRRHGLFILLSLLCLILSATERNSLSSSAVSRLLPVFLIPCSVFLTNCSSEKKQILEGAWAHYEGKYTEATADFLNVLNRCEDGELAQSYAVFDLASTYISLGETDSALDRLLSLNPDDQNLPADLRSAIFYNTGVIFSQRKDYKNAAANFKKAVLSDSRNLSAKINLELCERQIIQKQTKAAESAMTGVNEEKKAGSSMESEIFNLIRENEGKKWQNMSDGSEKDDNVLDY